MAAPKKKSGGSSAVPPTGGTRITFYGFGAYVASMKGATQCEWWPDDPDSLGWSVDRLIPTDLAKTPAAARAGQISVADIQVDDHQIDGGLTRIGPRFPQGRMIGGIWLSERYWGSLGANQPVRGTSDAHEYELTCYLYWDGPLRGRRFYGVHARGLDENGGLLRAEILQPGRGRVPGERPLGPFWLDLAQVSDPNSSPIKPGQEGALFLEDRTAQQFSVSYPKIPKSQGFERIT